MSESEERSAFPDVELEIEVKDKDGKVIHKHRQKARSWVKNFILFLRYGFTGGSITIIKQDGTVDSIPSNAYIGNTMGLAGGDGDDTVGIFVGSGTKPYSINDYSLAGKIPNSTLHYGPVSVEDLTDTGTTLYFGIARTFLNGSGNPITVSEVGLVIVGWVKYPLIARDLLSTPVTVPQGGTLTVRYVITYRYA